MDDSCCDHKAEAARPSTPDGASRAGRFAIGGSVLSAIAASACCWIPLLLIAFGLSAGGVAAWFEQYRWWFLGLTTVLLGTGFYFVYFRAPRCEPGSACARPNRKLHRANQVVLWVATVFVVAAAAFPKYVAYLFPDGPATSAIADSGHVATISLKIEGMTCEGCAVNVRNALVKVPGVLDASVSYPQRSATVTIHESSPPPASALASALEAAGYRIAANPAGEQSD